MTNALAKNLNVLARRYGNNKKRKYALKPAVVRMALPARLGVSLTSAKTDPTA